MRLQEPDTERRYNIAGFLLVVIGVANLVVGWNSAQLNTMFGVTTTLIGVWFWREATR